MFVGARAPGRVSNGTGQCNFSGQRDRQNFFVPGQRDNGTEVPSLARDKGTTGQARNLAMGWDGPGQLIKIWDWTRDGTITIFLSESGTRQLLFFPYNFLF